MTKKELEEKICEKFPAANFEILDWDGKVSHSITIKCLDCNTVKTYSSVSSIWRNKTRFCKKCSETLSQQQVRKIIGKKNYIFIGWKNERDINNKIIFRVEFQCPNCKQITNRRVWEMIHSDDECAYCGAGHRRKKPNLLFVKEIEEKFPNSYEILEEYKDAKTKIKVRHKECGFIFSITPDNLLRGHGCPRCNRYNSKGSKAIKEYLENNNILYETEKTFEWSNNKRYDFYLPKYNLLIEFNGEQHYHPIPFFLQNRSFEEQRAIDKEKEEKAIHHKYNFLVIKYDEVNKIPQILGDATTISKES